MAVGCPQPFPPQLAHHPCSPHPAPTRQGTLVARKELVGPFQRTTLSPKAYRVPRAGTRSSERPREGTGFSWMQGGQGRGRRGEAHAWPLVPLTLPSSFLPPAPNDGPSVKRQGSQEGSRGASASSSRESTLSRCQGPHHSLLWTPEGCPGTGGRRGGTDTRAEQTPPLHPWLGAWERSPGEGSRKRAQVSTYPRPAPPQGRLALPL